MEENQPWATCLFADILLTCVEENVTQAAKNLGISRATLQNKMKLYGLRSTKREEDYR